MKPLRLEQQNVAFLSEFLTQANSELGSQSSMSVKITAFVAETSKATEISTLQNDILE